MTSLLEELNLDLDTIDDPNIRRCFVGLLNIIQQLSAENARLREENQKLKDEIARLKGEQGRPDIKPNNKGDSKGSNISSEKQRRQKKNREKRKRRKLHIDRTVACPVARETLPDDAVYKGTETTVVQDLIFRRDNIAFKREKYWSPSLKKVFYGPLPPEYEDYKFGHGVRTFILTQYYVVGTSEKKILELLESVDVHMSAGELSYLLIHDVEQFHDEAAEIHDAGLESAPWHQIDDTSTRVNGVNHYCHVLGNPLYSVYRTMPRKDRPTVLAVLRGTKTPRYLVNDDAVALAAAMGVSGVVIGWFQERLSGDKEMDEAGFTAHYEKAMGLVKGQAKRKLFEAAALAAYRAQADVPVVTTLLGDDARQFDEITDERALCWIHDGRHYAKLTPMVSAFQKEVDGFLDKYWNYYRELRAYRQSPTPEEASRLEQAFDDLFTTTVDYKALQARIAKTLANKDELLLVLTHPELPLHNNDSELAARRRARKRDFSYGPRTRAGAKAWDSFQTDISTAIKVGISTYEYVADRVTGRGLIPRLAEVIRSRAAELNLGGSWFLASNA